MEKKTLFIGLMVYALSMGLVNANEGRSQENVAYLEIFLGKVQGNCSESDESLLEAAQTDAILRLGRSPFAMQRASDWNQNAYTNTRPFSDECRSKGAWAEAAFVNTNDLEKRWILIVSGSFTKYNGDNISDEEAFNRAIESSRTRASLFCKDELVEKPIAVYEKIKRPLDLYDLFSLRAQFECLHQ